jgi:phosphoglycerol transferase
MSSNNILKTDADLIKATSLLKALAMEWRYWIPGALLSFILASVLWSGWPMGLIPNLAYPYRYIGDSLSAAWLGERAIEGWVFDNPRSGYPFGSNFLDYPGSDSGSYLILKLLGLATGAYYSAVNLYFLLSFSATFISAFIVLSAIGLKRPFALSAAILFTFAPFHFLRIDHIFYVWYFVVPLFFYAAFSIFWGRNNIALRKGNITLNIILILGYIMVASFGIYYAVFGLIVLSTATLASWVRNRSVNVIFKALVAMSLIIFGVLLNLAPSLIYWMVNGSNNAVAVRPPSDSETYGFKMPQLIWPRTDHRLGALREITNLYNSGAPLTNENVTAGLGAIGAGGFVILLSLVFFRLAGAKTDERLSLLSALNLILFLFGIIGGLGSIFSHLITPSIRAWNRISIFIAFGALAAFFLYLQILLPRFFPKRHNILNPLLAFALCLFGLVDQTQPACKACNEQTRKLFEIDRNFVEQIESSVPQGSAIYQLPYMPFPEGGDLHRLISYDLLVPFLHSKSLRWSFAGMKGRDGDGFYKSLSQESVEKQLEVINRLGFAGIYIDRRGFDDNANGMIAKLTDVLGTGPTLSRVDGEVCFFKLGASTTFDVDGLTSAQIMKKAGYDKLGSRYPATLRDGIDFTKSAWPEFIRDVHGVSGAELGGRWSDANLAPSVKFDFFSALPQRFTLIFSGRAFGSNIDRDIVVKIGSQEGKFRLSEAVTETRIPFDLRGETVDAIEFMPPNPKSPKQLGINADERKLGMTFMQLRIEE